LKDFQQTLVEIFGSVENLANQSNKIVMEPRALAASSRLAPCGVRLWNGLFFEYMNSKWGSRGSTPWAASPSGGERGSPHKFDVVSFGMISPKSKFFAS